ncbi:MAG: septation protein A [Betaproteobacteria bacterium]|nr:septation protein A [Betaproteobacteria bacterium]
MKFLFELFPIILFFAVYKLYGIYEATAVAIAATFLQIGWVRFKHGKVEPKLWASLALIVVFGGATLLLHNETFIKWKPSVLYWLFGAVIWGAALAFKKNLIRVMMAKQIELPEPVWGRLLYSWIAFFALMGVLNLYVAYYFSTDAWVNFKLFGGVGLMLVFVFGQALMLSRHIQEKKPDEAGN